MKRTAAALIISLLLAAVFPVRALELETGMIRPFADNVLTVTSEDGGLLTIKAVNGTVPLDNLVTDMRVEGGTTEIPWTALTFGGEPLSPGSVTLQATLKGYDRTVEAAEIRQKVGTPMPAVLCCLPAARDFYPDGKHVLKIEIAVSGRGTYEMDIARKDKPEESIWHYRTTYSGRGEPMVVRWDGKGRNHRFCDPGEYIISVRSAHRPQFVQTGEITILDEPLPELSLAVTGPLIPGNLSDDAAVWAALTAPVAVGDGGEGKGLILMSEKSARSERAGSVNCRTVGLEILELYADGWAKVAGWRQPDGVYTEGYVKQDKLKMIRPNTRYGAVVDKKNQTMTVYEDGKRIGTVLVSTGWISEADRSADTRSGVYLMGTRMDDFADYGHNYCYPVRIDGYNLIHQMGYIPENGSRNFTDEMEALGTKASHGCIRVDARAGEENNGINAWWIWTHMGHDTKIIISE